jgi:hypothetical protein
MLPLIFKTANAAGNTDYVDGLFPDIELEIDYSNLGQLGNANEPLLAAALNNILPGPVAPRQSATLGKELDVKNGLEIMVVEGF